MTSPATERRTRSSGGYVRDNDGRGREGGGGGEVMDGGLGMGVEVRSIGEGGKVLSGSREEYMDMLLLVLLYLIQGIPLGLTFGSVPFLLQGSAR